MHRWASVANYRHEASLCYYPRRHCDRPLASDALTTDRTDNDGPKIIMSPLCKRAFRRDGIKVQVDIYRLEEGIEWTLEVIDEDDASIVWEEVFETDADAYAEFLRTVQTEGLDGLLREGTLRRRLRGA